MPQALETRLNTYSPAVLSLFRVVFGLLYTCHGANWLFGWPTGGPAAEIGAWPGFFAGIIELVAGILITLGLFTRIAAFIASGEMAVAYFTQHLPTGWIPMTNKGELSVLYCFAFFLLVFTGAGAYALDSVRRRH